MAAKRRTREQMDADEASDKHAKGRVQWLSRAHQSYIWQADEFSEGVEVPSVTAILSEGDNDSESLVRWAYQLGCGSTSIDDHGNLVTVRSEPWEQRRIKGTIGTCVHEMITSHLERRDVRLRDTPPNLAELAVDPFSRWEQWFASQIDLQVKHVEKQLVCASYGGTTDMIGVWDGKPCVFDWKTGNERPGELQFAQLAAYAAIALPNVADVNLVTVHIPLGHGCKVDVRPNHRAYLDLFGSCYDLFWAKLEAEAAHRGK